MYYDAKEIVDKVNIYTFLSNFLFLKKTRNGFVSLCPFHKDTHPSFFVNISKKRFFCFACHKNGNIIDFIMEYKNMSFYNAMRYFADKFNLNFKTKKNYTYRSAHRLLIDILNIYVNNLFDEYYFNYHVENFFIKRDIDLSLIKIFNLGYCNDSFHKTSALLYSIGYTKYQLLSSGIFFFIDNKLCDRFKNRIIFPIRNIRGEVIAFGGRSLGTDMPKYFNSSETILFSKKKEFYGLYEAMKFSHGNTVIIVEGYIDVLTLHKHGIKSVVAILGTAFTKEHFKKLNSFYTNIIFCYDGDEAGRLASIRTAFNCLSYVESGVYIGFILLPNGFDPDTFIKSGFKKKFLHYLKKPIYILDLIINRLKLKLQLNKIGFEKINVYIFLNKILKNLDNHIKKIIIIYFFKKFFNNEILFLNYLEKTNIVENDIISLSLLASIFLLKQKNLVFKIDIDIIFLNKEIKFFSDINFFVELVILLRRHLFVDFNFICDFLFKDKRFLKNFLKINNTDLILFCNEDFFTFLKKNFY